MPQHTPTRRAGYSLLELVLAVALVAGTLAPAMALLRDGMELSRTTDERQLLTNYAVQKLEERLSIVAAGWTSPVSGSASGDLAAEGFSSIRYTVTWSDAVASGGLLDQLIRVDSTTYLDADGDDAMDADEPRCVFRTKIAKFPSYEAAASP